MSEFTVLCEDATVTFGEVLALPRTSLAVGPSESVAIMGPSGSGKSTLLACIQGLQRPTGGSVTVLGQKQERTSQRARSDLRHMHFGLVQQKADLLEEFSAVENVAFPLLFDGMRRAKALAIAADAMDESGLTARKNADVRTVSGGEAQRIAVARALVRPRLKLLIADEPTASLDAENAQLITHLLLDQAKKRGASVLLATHDPRVAEQCDRVFHLTREHSTA